MYNVVFFAIVLIILQFTNAADRTVLYLVRSFIIFVGTFLTVGTLFGSKFAILNHRAGDKGSEYKRGSTGTTKYSTGTNPSRSNQSETSDDIAQENERLKLELQKNAKELEELRKELDALRNKIEDASKSLGEGESSND